ncbi:hypothetical protein TSUD_402880, partial [Trifolium subterraneum]
MGADKVFIRSSEGVDVMSIVNNAEEFFKLIFSNWTRWGEDVMPYHRGAWVRLYGVPLNAWNVNFFKLCVFNCGRFLRADSCSADKDRLDFAWVLIATHDLDIIKSVARVLVDGVLVEIKTVEEWGYAMGEDTCLFEEDTETTASQTDYEERNADPEVCRNAEILISSLYRRLSCKPVMFFLARLFGGVEVWSTESCEHVLWCHGRFTKSGEEFSVANVYAPCNDGEKQRLWDLFSARIQLLVGRRVCVCGDFNAVRTVDERRSARGGSNSLDHIPFNRFIDDNNLIDLPLSGRKFTWFKGDGLSMSRIDRFLLSGEWCLALPNCMQVARLRGLSDHCPIVLSANEEDWGPRPSRMLKCWRDVPGYNVFVRDKWNSLQVDGWGGYALKEKLKMIKAALKEWHSAHVQNLPSRIESLKARLTDLDQKGEDEVLSEDEIVELHGVSSDIHSLSRMNVSICRHRRNAISVIQVEEVTLEGVDPIRQVVFSHFASHFKATNVERPRVGTLQFKRLNQLESSSLTKPFSEAEVKSTVWDCDSFKSPGPDGINFGFIKYFWAELRGDVMRFISKFHQNGKLTKGINSTFIALIPKIDSPQRLNDFRPISLVGSLYKILEKVLANMLRLVIGRIISESQTAFVKDRQILDVDWGYLDDVMGRMSFLVLWRKWIKECVCTATTSVLVNGSPMEEFPLGRGIRQGDPLSPFLFLLAAEGLNVMMEAAVARNLFMGYSVGERDPVSVSHLQFADDTLLLGVKSWANVHALRVVLVLFETMSGLKVNFHKSMLVGVIIPDSWLGEAASALCCKVGKIPFLYLGLPIGGDSRRLGFWEPMLARLKTRLSGWKS